MVRRVLIVLCIGAALAELPAGFKTCKQSSPDYEECLKTQVSNALTTFKNGEKKMGVIPLDPLRFENLIVNQGSGPVSINLKMKNVDFKGISTGKILSVKNNWKEMKIVFTLDHLEQNGDYTIKGQILVLPISGDGKCLIIWEKTKVTMKMDLQEKKKGARTYYEVVKMDVGLEPKKVTVNFENLFNGNKELGDNMNAFLNHNWQVIISELNPAISNSLELGFKEYINRILLKIPANDINPK